MINRNNAFVKSWDFIVTIVTYFFQRYAEAGEKMAGSFTPSWEAKTFFSGLAEIFYLTAIGIFVIYLIFRGFGASEAPHSAALAGLIVLAIVTCIG